MRPFMFPSTHFLKAKALWHQGLFSELRRAVDGPVIVRYRPGRQTLGLFPEVLDLDLTGMEPHRGEPGGHGRLPETRPPQESSAHTRRSRVPGWGSFDEHVETPLAGQTPCLPGAQSPKEGPAGAWPLSLSGQPRVPK